MIRGAKRRDIIIQQQEKAGNLMLKIRQSIAVKREIFEATVSNLQAVHEQQRSNLLNSQKRAFANEKIIASRESGQLQVLLA